MIKLEIISQAFNPELQNESEKTAPVSKPENVEVIPYAYKSVSHRAQNLTLTNSDLETIPTGKDTSAEPDIEETPGVQEARVDETLQEILGLKMERFVPLKSKFP